MKKSILAIMLIICTSTMAFSQCSAYTNKKSFEMVPKGRKMVKGRTHSDQQLFAGLKSQGRVANFSKRKGNLRLANKRKK